MFYFKWIYDVEIVGLSQTTQNNTNCVLINKRKKNEIICGLYVLSVRRF